MGRKIKNMDLTIQCNDVKISSYSTYKVEVEINDVDKTDILDYFKEDDVINHFGEESLLESIGVDKVKEYFNLKNNEE